MSLALVAVAVAVTVVVVIISLIPDDILSLLVDTGLGQGKVEAGEEQAVEEKGPLRNGGLEDGI